MILSAKQLNRATLGRQLLLQREALEVTEGVYRVMALQAQEAASPYVALWNRLAHFQAADLDASFAASAVVKASLMRITLHVVHADDYPAVHGAMLASLRASRLGDPRFTESGLTTADLDALLPHLVEFTAQPRTKVEIEGMLAAHLGFQHPGVWWALRTFAPLWHAPTAWPWSFGFRPSFVTARPTLQAERYAEAVQHLVRRYLEAFGPASVQDVAQFTRLTRTVVRKALDLLGDELRKRQGPDGSELYDLPDGWLPDEDTPASPRLLPMWDSTLLAYQDRSRIIPPAYRRLVIRQNGDVLPTLLVDGYVAGVWRPVSGGIEATAFHPLSEATWAGLASEAEALVAFLAKRDPDVYRRYAHWWTSLPSAEVKRLPG
ncbi:winged helix DNA-binding domain-containing protein [Deinococcus hopiensis]|uniref:Winged helix DNA-binding domain-containing protein n=1 Tax=Deinococcus hopiensis KR-140 TaxID=695939 RepID=A0A1W1UKE6_9DEIO|nr:winged helix DNA-binding domain-containing protein [Deinococcus hopiensis]SMB81547.1 Winged helix DNA-binding domain-containing protein [Deinococcus hopiensis KR-140]